MEGLKALTDVAQQYGFSAAVILAQLYVIVWLVQHTIPLSVYEEMRKEIVVVLGEVTTSLTLIKDRLPRGGEK